MTDELRNKMQQFVQHGKDYEDTVRRWTRLSAIAMFLTKGKKLVVALPDSPGPRSEVIRLFEQVVGGKHIQHHPTVRDPRLIISTGHVIHFMQTDSEDFVAEVLAVWPDHILNCSGHRFLNWSCDMTDLDMRSPG